MGLEAHQPTKDVSLALDLADTPEKKAMIRLMSSHLALGRPYLGPPGMNPDRKAELHKAFMAAMADPELRAEYAKARSLNRRGARICRNYCWRRRPRQSPRWKGCGSC